jgi:hypothetical protein
MITVNNVYGTFKIAKRLCLHALAFAEWQSIGVTCTPSHQSCVEIHDCYVRATEVAIYYALAYVFTLLSWWILTGKICKYGSESPPLVVCVRGRLDDVVDFHPRARLAPCMLQQHYILLGNASHWQWHLWIGDMSRYPHTVNSSGIMWHC